MYKQVIEILSDFAEAQQVCVMGNLAVARGAIEANVQGVFSYPGTPSTEISELFNRVNEFQNNLNNREKYPELTEHQIYFEYSINEKIALEKAIAYSIGNKNALCVMKNVGMNVAADALMSITYQTIGAPLVIIVCDDPGCFSSSNEQDSRYWGKFASVPLFNPSIPADALTMTKDAFSLSAHLKLPVIVRMTTRVDHSRGMVKYGKIGNDYANAHFDKLKEHINIPNRVANAHRTLLTKLNAPVFAEYYTRHNCIKFESGSHSCGIIASGVAIVYASEILSKKLVEESWSKNEENIVPPILQIGLLNPFPVNDILRFLKRGFNKILVLEELDPIVEDEIRIIAQKNKIDVEILGKDFSTLQTTGEYTLDIIRQSLEEFLGCALQAEEHNLLPGIEQFTETAPQRPPTLCAGCPHRATFYALKMAIPRDDGKIIMCGDIGCFGLGALPPLMMIDTVNHMGMSISMAQGLSAALQLPINEGKLVALLGDGTFFHSGVASLINAVYTRANILVIVFDNRTIGMTGHQANPGANNLTKYHQLDVFDLVKGIGVPFVENMNPFNLLETYDKVKRAIEYEGVSVLIARAPCIFLPEFKDGAYQKRSIQVDPNKCNTCFNHCDSSIFCSKSKSSINSLNRATARVTSHVHIPAQEQLCPANICNHGFFNAIRNGSYKEALEMIRDKMLFARVCGDICHKPCETLFVQEGRQVVPIKSLKKMVSGIEENFNDFSHQIAKASAAMKNGKKVAIIGAGPAGLSAAYDLVRNGYDITIYEKNSSAGGMVRYVIPDFRMDKEGMDKEMDVLVKMGVVFHFNTDVGRDISIDQLSVTYDAVILANGIWKNAKLDIVEQKVDKNRRFDAVSFLFDYNTKNLKINIPSTILVIGGGNSAMDAARAAMKLNPGNQVILSCIEKWKEMPAFAEEIAQTLEEGIEIIDNTYIDSIDQLGDKVYCNLNSFDKKNYQNTIVANYVITAIGQKGETDLLLDKFEIDNNSRITKIAGYSNVFVAGDTAAENHISLIGAIGSGKNAAVEVRKLLENYTYDYEGQYALNLLRESSILKNDLNTFHSESSEFNIGDFDLFQPCGKCDHCIENFGCPAMVKVDGRVVIDEKRCTKCGLCIDVCPNGAIHWVTEE